jgi:predicted outer membrane protein
MATRQRVRVVSREELAYQMGHKLPDLRTTDRYTKFDKRYLATAIAMIEQIVRDLNKLTKRNLLQPDTSKILPRRLPATTFKKTKTPLITVVGAAWIEHATPTMST